MPSRQKTIGLALGSGGLRGFAHLGVIQSLQKHNIPISSVSGSSIGALVAAYYALYGEVDSLRDKILSSKGRLFRLFDLGFRGGLVSGNKYEKFIEQLLGNHTFADTIIPLRIVATELSSGQPVVFSAGKLTTAVRASSSVPVVFEPVKQQKQRFVDGALSDPVPVNTLKELGEASVVAVNLYHRNEFIEKKFTFTKVALRSVRIAFYNLSQHSMIASSVRINPDASRFIQHLNLNRYLSPESADEMIRVGKKEADKNMDDIKKLL